ncbi:MAG: prephenate dehydrogenase/arogenate dehydrogenase family protein [Anaerolineaceae bacterium]|nr:prephenate dehydrogenase/arogenate dehydrogenase family protein [Anaerolineaceae bacterium]
MTVQITIIGMGQIGTSIGLALADHTEKIYRVGHDIRNGLSRDAEKSKAIDKSIPNLYAAVKEANIIILAIPVDQVRETLELISGDLQEGSVVMDTSTCMVATNEWAKELLPPDRHYVTIHPSINPEYIDELASGGEAAHADLFKKGLMVITTPPGGDTNAIRLATELAALLGATPFYVDSHEFDGLSAATNLLPQIMAAALVNSTIDQPGWTEGRKLASQFYAHATKPLLYLEEEKNYGQTALLNKENASRVINDLMFALRDLRDAIADGDEKAVEKLFTHAQIGRADWWSQRMGADWDRDDRKPEMPSAGESITRFFAGGLFKRRKEEK